MQGHHSGYIYNCIQLYIIVYITKAAGLDAVRFFDPHGHCWATLEGCLQSGPALHACGSVTYCTHGKGVLICPARDARDG